MSLEERLEEEQNTQEEQNENEEQETNEEEVEETEQEETSEEEVSSTSHEKYTPRERALMNKARAEEKQKLYKELKEARTKLRELEEKLAQNESKPRTRKRDEDADDIRQEIRQLRQELAESQRKAELKAYRAERIAEVRAAGGRVIDMLVVGDSEEEIDASLEVAKAEAELLYREAEENVKKTIKPPTRHTITREKVGKKPEGVPPTIRGGSSDTPEDSLLTIDDVRRMTSMNAIRDGSYAQNRKKLFEALYQGRIRNS